MNVVYKNRENKTAVRIAAIASRRLGQGENVDEQYTRLNAARDKRAKRRKRNANLAFGASPAIIVPGVPS
jgi:hypothetical protein